MKIADRTRLKDQAVRYQPLSGRSSTLRSMVTSELAVIRKLR